MWRNLAGGEDLKFPVGFHLGQLTHLDLLGSRAHSSAFSIAAL